MGLCEHGYTLNWDCPYCEEIDMSFVTKYCGKRTPDGETVVTVNDRPLPLRLDLRNHSPTGFEWGYHGSGPAQLALAICAYHTGSGERAQKIYQTFKDRVIARLHDAQWVLTSDRVEEEISRIEREISKGQHV